MNCLECAAPVARTDAYCENCGAELTFGGPAPPPVAQSRGNGRDHLAEQPSPAVAAVTDRGRLHPRNEDAFALAVAGGFVALVVCDGVTTAADSDVASLAAATAARDLLAAAPRPDGSAQARHEHWAEQLRAAALAADDAASAGSAADAHEPGASEVDVNPPSCTFVAAVADGEVIVAASVGDSRAYWLPDDGPAEQLTVDDSWATEQVRAGVPREQAEADPKGHAITKWLGMDAPEVDASTAATVANGPGWLLVCSDGLWNYCSDAGDLRAVVAALPPEPPARAEALIDWANEQGGHDNVTVALARIGDTS